MKTYYAALLLALAILSLVGCNQSGQSRQSDQPASRPELPIQAVSEQPSTPLEIIEAPEGQPYRLAAVKEDARVNWHDATSCLGQLDSETVRKEAQAAIKSEAARLAQVDYAALSLPAFVTVTRSLKLSEADFNGGEVVIDGYGEVGGSKRWALYSWRGPEIPKLPDRQLVNRWVQVYALYDLRKHKVVRLLATVRGEAIE